MHYVLYAYFNIKVGGRYMCPIMFRMISEFYFQAVQKMGKGQNSKKFLCLKHAISITCGPEPNEEH